MTPNRDDHAGLSSAAEPLVEALAGFDSRMIRDEIDHVQHRDFARRAHFLSGHLRAAMLLSRSDLYPAAFAVLRTALEHQVLDELAMLGDRYVQVFSNVQQADFDELVRRFDEGLEPTIQSRPTLSNRRSMRIVRRGVYDRDADPERSDETVSVYYFVLDDYRPTFPRPGVAASRDDGLGLAEHRVASARRNAALWDNYLRWGSAVESLEVNELYSSTQIDRLLVHYRFLSGYAHAVSASYAAAYDFRGLLSPEPPAYDHYSSELVLLYVLMIASDELSTLIAMTQRPPVIEVGDPDELSAILGRATEAGRHLWPPRGSPHEYDKIAEANARTFAARRDGDREFRPPPVDAIPGDEVRYYDDPLKRIVSLHSSSTEMPTGIAFRSPFPRSDAQLRRT